MTHLKTLAAAATVAGGLGLAPASAAPLALPAANVVAGSAHITDVAYGCGPGFAPNRFGYCRPIYRPYGYYRPRPYYYGPPRFYGPRPYYGRPRFFY